MELKKFSKKKSSPKFTNLSNCLEKIQKSWEKQKSLAGIWQDWEKIAGTNLSKNCQPISIRGGVLFIGASHPQWRQALQYNKSQLLASLRASGHELKDIKIQQFHPTKIKPQVSETTIWSKHPSRVDIHGISICGQCNCPSPAGEMKIWGKCSFCRRKELNK